MIDSKEGIYGLIYHMCQYYIFALEELTSSYEIGIGFGIMEKH